MTNYTIADALRALLAFVLFAPCVLFPGYALGSLSDVLEFRARGLAEKLLIAVPLSVAVAPLLIYLTGLVSMRLTWIALGITAVAFAVLLGRDLLRSRGPAVNMRVFLALAAGWIVIGLASLVDYQWGDRLYIPTTSWDYTIRVAFTDAITRTGTAPVNPFYTPGRTFSLRYHYFWMLPASIVDQLGGALVRPFDATLAGTLWSGLSLMALVVLFVWYFQSAGRPISPRRAWFGVALLAVTGLDIIPMLFYLLLFNHIPYNVDTWNEIIAGWASSLLWVPHHVAAVVACLTGFLVLWTGSMRRAKDRIVSAIVAGAAFACSAGLSIYVCLVFAAALLVFGAVALWKRWSGDVLAIAVAGASAAVFALPYLVKLLTAPAAQSGPFLQLTVRAFPFPENLLAAFNAPRYLVHAVSFVLLPVNYGLELGLLFLVGAIHALRLARRRRPLNRREWAEVALIGAPVLICTFLRSSVIVQNDLGWRGFLIPQFVLMLWSIDYVRIAARANVISAVSKSRLARLNSMVVLAAGLGLTSTIYGLIAGRAFLPMLEAGWVRPESAWFASPDLDIGRRMLGQRVAAEWIATHVPRDAALLENPDNGDVWSGLHADRQQVLSQGRCATVFGGADDGCPAILARVFPVFSAAAMLPPDIDSLCRRYGIRAIFVKDYDPVWHDPRSWVWQRKPAFANSYARVFACGPAGASQPEPRE